MYSTSRTHSSTVDTTIRKFFLFTVGLVVLFVMVQFFKLASLGRIGDDISQVKNNQNSIELQNEILRMEINELRRSSILEEEIISEGNLVKKDVKIITNIDDTTSIAQN
jgi:regulator of replication initiation timing